MSLPTLMQKGLAALLQMFKFAGYEGVNKAIVTLNEHFTLTAYEIAQAYQESYESALQAISLGLGKSVLLPSRVMTEFAQQVVPHYWQPFTALCGLSPQAASILSIDISAQCQALAKCKTKLFIGKTTPLTEGELASLITNTDSQSITQLVLEQLQHLDASGIHLNEKIVAFFSYNDLLGVAIQFFFYEQLRQERRVESTLAAIQRQGLWQDVRELKTSLQQMMTQLEVAAPTKSSQPLLELVEGNFRNEFNLPHVEGLHLLNHETSNQLTSSKLPKEAIISQKTEPKPNTENKPLSELVEGNPKNPLPELVEGNPKNPLPELVEGNSNSTWDKELAELLELARRKYEHPLTSFSSPLVASAMAERMSDAEADDIYTTCPYCHNFITVTVEGSIECPNCQGGFEVDDDGDVISCYDDESEE